MAQQLPVARHSRSCQSTPDASLSKPNSSLLQYLGQQKLVAVRPAGCFQHNMPQVMQACCHSCPARVASLLLRRRSCSSS